MDLELCRGLWRFFRGMAIGDETLALQEIDQVGAGEEGTFLNREITARRFREALWMPQLLDTAMWRDGQEAGREQEMLRRANRQ